MLKHSQYMIARGRVIIFLGVAIALIHWFGEGMVHFYVFDRRDLADALLPSDSHELWMRSLVVCIIIAFSIFAQMIVNTLYETGKRYQILFENAPDAIFITDSESGVISDANPAASKLLLRPHHEIVGLHQTKLHPPVKKDDSTKIFNIQVERSRQKKKVQPVEQVILRSDGMEVPVEIVAKTANLGDKSILQGIFRDITERKAAEEALKKSEKKFRTLVSNIPDVTWTSNFEGDTVFISPNVERVYGYSPQEIYEQGDRLWLKRIHPDDFGHVQQAYVDLFHKNMPFDIEYRIKRKDGQWIWLQDRSIATYEEDSVQYADGIFSDITKRKEADKALKESEEKYKTLVENAVETIATIDENGVFLFMNTIAAKNLGGKPEDYIGKTMWDLFPKEIANRQATEVKKVINTRRGINRIISSEVHGKLRWYNASVEPLRDSHGNVSSAMVIAHDITESRRVQEELEVYRGEMARTEQLASLGTLSATVAHELTQPLTVIQLSIENALDELEGTSYPEPVNNKLRRSIAELSNINVIIDRFRNFARRSIESSISEVDLQAVGERIVNLLNRAALQTRTTLHIEDMDDLPHIEANEKDLEQLFFALIYNAILSGDAFPNRKVVVSSDMKDGHIELCFSDTSGGIPPENLDRIFEPFFTTRPARQGTGLGLCLVQDIVDRARGKIWVESKFGEGSTFFVRLPIGRNMKS